MKSAKLSVKNTSKGQIGMDFERGLEQLKEIAEQAGWYQDVLPFEAALRISLRDERLYSWAPQTRSEQLRAVDQLNGLCLKRLNRSFNELCEDIVPFLATQPARLERAPGATLCLYSSEDEIFYRALRTALSLWQQQGKLTWLEERAGDAIASVTQEHLRQAELILLLCSADFFADTACYAAMQLALQEHQRRQVPVVPILARACAWEESACAHLKILPENKRPLNEWAHPDQAYEEIRRSLIHLL